MHAPFLLSLHCSVREKPNFGNLLNIYSFTQSSQIDTFFFSEHVSHEEKLQLIIYLNILYMHDRCRSI
jgi:hypothetical protein